MKVTLETSDDLRGRILRAAMDTFIELGYSNASTLKIATRAKVSKRELYACFGTKQSMLAACIVERANRMRPLVKLPSPRNRDDLASMLATLGAGILREVSHPEVVAVFRLAITEAQRAPEVADTLESARQSVRDTIAHVIAQAKSAGLIGHDAPRDMEVRFLSLLWDDLMVMLLLRQREAPGAREIDRRARRAAEDFLALFAP